MNKNDLLKNLEKLNMRPGRGLGQNFLLDNNLLEFIARSANITPGEVVLEVGPGFGALTEKLLAHGAELYAVEFDHRVCDFLRENHKESNFHLTEGDGKHSLPGDRQSALRCKQHTYCPFSGVE